MGAEYFDTAQTVAASDGRDTCAAASLLHEGGAGIWRGDQGRDVEDGS